MGQLVSLLAFIGIIAGTTGTFGCAASDTRVDAGAGAFVSADGPAPGLDGTESHQGPKCTVELAGGPPVECLSAGIARHGDTTVLTFNFCWQNDSYICGRPGTEPVAIDGIFILPGPSWQEGFFREATGFLDVQVRGGAHHRLEPAAPGGAIPIDLRVTREPVAGGGTTLRGRLGVDLPRVDRPGDPLAFRATIN